MSKTRRALWAAALAAALTAAGAVPASAAPEATCTINVQPPAKLSINSFYAPMKIKATSAEPCVSLLGLELIKVGASQPSDQTMFGMDELASGNLEWNVNIPENFTAGKYTLRDNWWSVKTEWTNGRDVALNLISTQIDARLASRTSLTATRTQAGVALSGSTDAYSVRHEDFIASSNVAIALQKKSGATWSTVRTVTTASNGTFSATIADHGAGAWRAVRTETATTWGASSPERVVAARKILPAKVTIAGKRTGNVVAFTGAVTTSPGTTYTARAGAKVNLQLQSGSTWKTVATTTSTSTGAISAKHTNAGAGTYRWEVVAGADYTRAVSSNAFLTAVPTGTKVTTKAKRSGSTVTVTGKVTAKAGSKYVATSGIKVKLQRKSGSKWTTLKTVTSKKAGKVSIKIKSDKKATYRLTVPATAKYAASTSKAVSVAAKPKKPIATISIKTGNGKATGVIKTQRGKKLTPAAGEKVKLQIEVNGKWKTIATTTSGKGGKLSAKFPDWLDGFITMRWYVPATKTHGAAASQSVMFIRVTTGSFG